MRSIIQGISIRMASMNTIRRGMELKAVSWMEVTICVRLMTTPAAKAMAISGAAIQNAASSAWRRISTTESVVMRDCSVKALHQRSDHQVPAIHQYEQQNLEGRRDHDRRQLHHAHRQGYRVHHQIDDQEGQVEHRADLKGSLQLRQDISRNQDLQIHIGRGARGRGMRDLQKQGDVLLAGEAQPETAQRL